MSYDLKGQATYDAMIPDDEYCPVCGLEWSTECICTGDERNINEEQI